MAGPATGQRHAFISYLREDTAEVDRLQDLLSAHGITVWRDTQRLLPGDDWSLKIQQAITRNSLVFIACFSGNYWKREDTYQNSELLVAIDQHKRRRPGTTWLIPVRFSECALPSIDIGGGCTLDSLQRADLFGDHWGSQGARLVEVVQHTLASLGEPRNSIEPNRPATDAPNVSTGRNLGALEEIRRRLEASCKRERLVLAVSAHNLDTVCIVDRIAADHEERLQRKESHPGGSGANTAAAVAALRQASAVAGIVSDDEAGATLASALSRWGVDTALLERGARSQGDRTGEALVFADSSGGRVIYIDPGVNEKYALRILSDDTRYDALRLGASSSRVLHLSSFSGATELYLQKELVKDVGSDRDLIVSLAPGALYASRGLDALGDLMGRSNLLFLYDGQLQELVERSSARRASPPISARDYLDLLFAWRRVHSAEPALVVVKFGFRSATQDFLLLAAGRDKVEEVCTVPLQQAITDSVVDSTGAGDAIAAGIHVGLANRRNLSECADIACMLAGMVCRFPGARTGCPTYEGFQEGWQSRFPGRGRVI